MPAPKKRPAASPLPQPAVAPPAARRNAVASSPESNSPRTAAAVAKSQAAGPPENTTDVAKSEPISGNPVGSRKAAAKKPSPAPRKRKAAVETDNWYHRPAWYDLAFRSETEPEVDFFEAAFRKYAIGPVRSVLEPACGTGRLIVELAARGYEPVGFDLSLPALAYLRRKLARRKLRGAAFAGDMAEFVVPADLLPAGDAVSQAAAPKAFPSQTPAEPAIPPAGAGVSAPSPQPVAVSAVPTGGRFDAACCTFDGFRHLLDEASARRHLECVAETVRPGGIYILGFHLLPPDADESCTERWTEQHGGTRVTVTLRVVASDRAARVERLRISLLVRQGDDTHRLRDEFPLRLYEAAQVRSLLASVPAWELLDVFDFWYEIDHPLELDDEISDTVLILRRR